MIKTITPKTRTGEVTVPSSKSMAHRYLICAALSEEESVITCNGISDDIQATIDCLNALGAQIEVTEGNRIHVRPIKELPSGPVVLNCRESGSTLRFLLPIVGVLGLEASFVMEGNLPRRTPQVYLYEMIAHGMNLVQEGSSLTCSGKLLSGLYQIPGNISSQFVSGLLMASPLMDSDNIIRIGGRLQSKDYVTMTEDALTFSGVGFGKGRSAYLVYGDQKYGFPNEAAVEGDWSSAAFFLCLGALSEEGILVRGLSMESPQGDKRIVEILKEFGAVTEIREDGVFVKKGELKGIIVDAADIPDLIPAVCAVAAHAQGTTGIANAGRLRLKESDRIRSIVRMLESLGVSVEEREEEIIIYGTGEVKGGIVDSYKDHRIAMAAAVAAAGSNEDVVIEDAECVGKSYPAFWEHLEALKEE